MKLHYNQASPFVRKVLIVAHEHGIFDQLELVPAAITPVAPSAAVAEANPVGKIPALVLEDGSSLFDSAVIVEYLDHVGGGSLLPAAGPARWRALRLQAVADGLMDAAILVRYERGVRPAEKQWDAWIDGQLLKVRQSLAALEAEASSFAVPGTIGEITVGAALAYLDFRFPDEGWRTKHPGLASFYARIAEHPSFVATVPPAA